jgi:hypothetical protein
MMDEKKVRLLALVPHRDARLPLRKWSASLFAAGVPGAWSFPWAAPLALLKRPLSSEELKSLARALRLLLNENNGKLTAAAPALSALSADSSGTEEKFIFGPSLQIKFPDDFFAPAAEAIACRITPLVLGAALIKGINIAGQSPAPAAYGGFPRQSHGVVNPSFPHSLDQARASTVAISLRSSIRGKEKADFHSLSFKDIPAPPEVSFRAAALANMVYYEKNDNFFEWKIGPLQWMPKK